MGAVVMDAAEMAQAIRNKAIEVGFEDCGIINVSEVHDYQEKLDRRIARFSDPKPLNDRLMGHAHPEREFPWAKSLVVCAFWLGHYKFPEHMEGRFGRAYMADNRRAYDSVGYKASVRFEEYMQSLGLQAVTKRDYGLTGVRWAAMKAGIGVVRKNNFFYTRRGSWCRVEVWAIDRELELKGDVSDIAPCPENCNLCIKACPTKSLAEPYLMNAATCVSFMTTKGMPTPGGKEYDKTENWVYGCDTCQDVCPKNRGSLTRTEEFPGLAEFGSHISPEQLVVMDYDYLRNVVTKRFWYIEPEDAWKYKVDALNWMHNNFKEEYKDYLILALQDEEERVRDMAAWVLDRK